MIDEGLLSKLASVRILPKRTKAVEDMQIVTDPAAIAAAFARAVTVLTNRESLVARNGDLSIFSAYRRIFPQARCKCIFNQYYL